MDKIASAEKAVQKADEFVEKYYLLRRLEEVKKVDSTWIVKYDVSILGPKEIITVNIDSATGEILEYSKSA